MNINNIGLSMSFVLRTYQMSEPSSRISAEPEF
jgi:hypothetical protein